MKLFFSWNGLKVLVVGTVANQNPSFQIIDTKLYVPVVTLSTQENINVEDYGDFKTERAFLIQKWTFRG